MTSLPIFPAAGSVLVVGDIMLDRYVFGRADRLSAEGPVPVLCAGEEEVRLGGAGNVLANLHGLGVPARIVAVAGQDAESETLRDLIRDCGVDPDIGLVHANDRPTTTKTRFIARNQQMLRVDRENTAPVAEGLERKVIDAVTKAIEGMRVVILSDYGKGVLTPDVIETVLRLARKAGIVVLVDPKGRDAARYRGADIMTPNRNELRDMTGLPTDTDEQVTNAALALMKTANLRAVIATRSEQGMSVVEGDNAVTHLPTRAREVYDVSGAGDTVIATIAAVLAARETSRETSLVAAADIANQAAGIVVGKLGTVAITRAELETLSIASNSTRTAPVLSLDAAANIVADWRKAGLRVGFTNGCFDILHAGHTMYLEDARTRCDRLVVAVNADSSVQRLKGPSRPVNDADARMRVLAALAAVDLVVPFGDTPDEQDEPVKALMAIRPDILIKGGDYRPDQVVGADFVLSYGGEVCVTPMEEGKSTTATLAKLKAKTS